MVVGGAGYIGSHLVRTLSDLGEALVVVDNLEQGHRESIADTEFFQADLRHAESLSGAFQKYPDVDVVIHLAAYISVGESVRDPGKYWRNNTVGVLNLLTAMGQSGVSKIVFSSTAAIFGEPKYTPIDEDHPKAPASPYGYTKLAVENMFEHFEVSHGLRSVCLRYFNASGADPSGSIGEDHAPEEHLIPVAMLAALGRRPSLKVFGTDYDTPDGTCVRDYIHICDLADAHVLAVKHLRSGGDSRRYNLGNGEGYSVRQVIETVSDVIGQPVPYELADRRPGDPAVLVGSSQKIREDWGWTPKRPALRTIVEDAWRWHSSHPEGYGSTR